MKATDLWEEFIVYVELPHLPGYKVPMCGLCGNSGKVDTRGRAICTSHRAEGTVDCGTVGYCICPNGRADKKAQTHGQLPPPKDTT